MKRFYWYKLNHKKVVSELANFEITPQGIKNSLTLDEVAQNVNLIGILEKEFVISKMNMPWIFVENLMAIDSVVTGNISVWSRWHIDIVIPRAT